MPKQKSLPLDKEEGQQALDALWELFPEVNREAVVTLFARTMLSTIRGEEKASEEGECSHEE